MAELLADDPTTWSPASAAVERRSSGWRKERRAANRPGIWVTVAYIGFGYDVWMHLRQPAAASITRNGNDACFMPAEEGDANSIKIYTPDTPHAWNKERTTRPREFPVMFYGREVYPGVNRHKYPEVEYGEKGSLPYILVRDFFNDPI